VERVVRRTLIVAGSLAVAGLVGCSLLGYPLAGAGMVAGLAMGAFNALGMRRMVGRAAATGEASKRALAGASMSRLGVVTAGVFILFLVSKTAGLGSLGGLALFQMALLANSSRVLLRQLRRGIGL
jgi:hypothetical protein